MTTEVTPVPPLTPPKTASSAALDVQNVRGPIQPYQVLILRGSIIGAGVLGALLFIRNSKLFARLKHVNEIPEAYIRKELQLKGIIRAIDSNAVIKVEHQPIVTLPAFLRPQKRPSELLRVRLAGVDVSKAGVEHLVKDLKLRDRKIFFNAVKPTSNDSDSMDADVIVKKNYVGAINLNTDLVRKGFARVHQLDDQGHIEALQSNGAYSRLVHRLLTAEQIAEKRGLGVWARRGTVEWLQSLPVAAGEIARHNALTKLVLLTSRVVYDMFMLVAAIVRQVWHFGVASVDYMGDLVRRLGARVDALARFYERLRGGSVAAKSLEAPSKPSRP